MEWARKTKVACTDEKGNTPTVQRINSGHRVSSLQAHKALAEARFKEKGWPGLWQLFKLYIQMLAPVAVFSIYLTSLFAFFSYMVPNVFCREQINKTVSQGLSNAGFRACTFNAGKDYHHNMGYKIFWLLYWAMEWTWLVLFPFLMGHAMAGPHFRKRELLTAYLALAAMFFTVLLNGPFGRFDDLNNEFYYYLMIPLSTITTISSGVVLARYSNDYINVVRWMVMFVVAGGAVLIYFIFMPKIITQRIVDHPFQLLLTRLVIHPIIWEIMIQFFIHMGRHIGRVRNLMQSTMYIWPMMYRALFGRFLLLQLSGAGSVGLLNVMLALMGVISRLGSRSVGGLLLTLMYGSRTAEAIQATTEMNQIRHSMAFARMISEYSGILCSAMMYTVAKISTDGLHPLSPAAVWKLAVSQLAVFFIQEFICMVFDWKFHSVNYFAHWVKDMRMFCFYLAIIITIGGARICVELILLFCPAVAPNGDILLSYCAKHTLFDMY